MSSGGALFVKAKLCFVSDSVSRLQFTLQGRVVYHFFATDYFLMGFEAAVCLVFFTFRVIIF